MPSPSPHTSNEDLQALFQRITASIDLAELLTDLGGRVERTGHFDGHLIYLRDEAGESLSCESVRLPDKHRAMQSTLRNHHLPFDFPDVHCDCLLKATPLLFNERPAQPTRFTIDRFTLWELSAMAILPIICQGQTIGTLTLIRQQGQIDPGWLPPLENLLHQFACQIRNALQYHWLKAKEAHFETLLRENEGFRSFVSQINSLTSEEHVYAMISHEFLRRFSFDIAAIMLREGDELVIKQCTDISGQFGDAIARWNAYAERFAYRIDQPDGASVSAFLRNSYLHFHDAMEVLHLPMSEKDREVIRIMQTPRTFLCMPIRQQNTPVGILWLFSLQAPVELDDASLRTIEQLCAFIGTAIANAKLYGKINRQNREIEELNEKLRRQNEQLNQLAIKDRLTGLYNYGYFQEDLQRRIKTFQRQKGVHPLALTILDIDHFKHFNDTYGHPAGNQVLSEIAQRILVVAREVDVACRFGGEEFTVTLPDCDVAGAKIFAERLRSAIATAPIFVDGVPLSVTISLGCAGHVAGESMSQFVERADSALYEAKKNGRNCVRTAS